MIPLDLREGVRYSSSCRNICQGRNEIVQKWRFKLYNFIFAYPLDCSFLIDSRRYDLPGIFIICA